jgi:hypothetical protein
VDRTGLSEGEGTGSDWFFAAFLVTGGESEAAFWFKKTVRGHLGQNRPVCRARAAPLGRQVLILETANEREWTRIRFLKSDGCKTCIFHQQGEIVDLWNSLEISVHSRSFAVSISHLG